MTLVDDAVAGALRRSVTLSPCGIYRYDLTRTWGYQNTRLALWIMLNPSTADAEIDDQTVRNCVTFSKRWGYGGLAVVNLFALRATKPKELYGHPDPVGPDNDAHIVGWSDQADLVVAAWGAHGDRWKRPAEVLALLKDNVRDGVQCLGRTKNGHPRHPGRLAHATPLERLGGL